MEFINVSGTKKSYVWQHFLYNEENVKAKCRICSVVLQTHNSTSSMVKHLKNKHGIAVNNKRFSDDAGAVVAHKSPRTEGCGGGLRTPLNTIIAEMVSVDGLNFNQLANSKWMHKIFSLAGYDLPKTAQGISELFHKSYDQTLHQFKREVMEEKQQGKRFSISLDESTTKRNRR